MKKKFFLFSFIIALSLVFTTVIAPRNTAYAAVDQTAILKKWDFTQFYRCFQNYVKKSVPTGTDNTKITDSIFNASANNYLPSYQFQHTLASGNLPTATCPQFLAGDGSKLKGALDFYSGGSSIKSATWHKPSEAASAMEELGYTVVENEGQVFTIKATSVTTTDVSGGGPLNEKLLGLLSDKLVDLMGKDVYEVDSATITVTPDGDNMPKYKYSLLDNLSSAFSVSDNSDSFTIKLSGDMLLPISTAAILNGITFQCSTSDNSSLTVDKEKDIDVFYDHLMALKNKTWTRTCVAVYSMSNGVVSGLLDLIGGLIGGDVGDFLDSLTEITLVIKRNYYFGITKEAIVNSADKAVYAYADTVKTATSTIQKMSGMSLQELRLTDSERYTLYYYYLDKFLDANAQYRVSCNPPEAVIDTLEPIILKDTDGQFKTCYINLNGASPSTTVVSTQFWSPNGDGYPYIATITMDKVIQWFNDLTESQTASMADVDAAKPSGVIVGEDGSIVDLNIPQSTESSGSTSCMKDGGKALGWILCPLLELAGEAVESAYTNFLEPQLQINPELLAGVNGNSNPTQEAWSVFRNFANIIFVIMLLVIIFSQLTGIGIDNYGIKRTLPKLIIAAILVNLSYIICQLCVDVSNIIGNGIQNLLESINFTAADSTLSGWEITGTGLMTSVGIIGAVVGGIIFVVYNPATLLTLLLSIISALFAILFAFVLLVVRKAALVLLVILSPLAFVCYMLPNTKRLFDQWMKAGMDLLIVYPICGLLIGGGNFISRLLLVLNLESNGGDGGFLAALIAMLAGIIPLFMIPTILRGAFSSMGSLGAKISGAGKRISGGITRGLDKSNTFANARQAGAEHTARMLGGVDKNGNPKQLSGFGKLIRGGTRNIARNRLKHLNNEDDKAKADFLVNQGSVGYEAEKVAREKSSKNNRVDAWEKLINSRTNNGENEKAFNDVVGEYAAKGNVDGLVAAARIAGRRKDSADSFIARWLTGNGKEEPIENSALRQAVAKEIATGSNSSNYMSSNPFRFEYASQLNNGKISDPSLSYSDWLRDKDKDGFYHNAGTALNNYVNNSQQLLAMKGSAFTELLGNDGELLKGLDSGTQDKMYGLAKDTISNHDKGTGPWEADKAKHIHALADFAPSQAGTVVEKKSDSSAQSSDAAQEGESFSTRGVAAGSTGSNGGGWYNTSTSNATGNSAEGWYTTSTASAGGASGNVGTATNVNVNGPATVSAGTSTATGGRTDAGAQAGGTPAQSSDNKADLARIARGMDSIDSHLDRLRSDINNMAGQMAVGAAQQPRILQTPTQAPQVMPSAFGSGENGGLTLRQGQPPRSQNYSDVGQNARDIESRVKIEVSGGNNGSPILMATGGGQALDTQLRLGGDRRPTQAPSRQANNNGGGNAGGNSGGA